MSEKPRTREEYERRYPRLVWSEGRLVDEHTLTSETQQGQTLAETSIPPKIPRDYAIKKEESKKETTLGRRAFLGALGAGALGALAKISSIEESKEKINQIPTEVPTSESVPTESHTRIPYEPEVPKQSYSYEAEHYALTIQEQFEQFDRIQDLKGGLVAHEAAHFEYLTKHPNGKLDMKLAVKNMLKLNMEKFVKPFTSKKLPEHLAYMIAIQESRGKLETVSFAGARGITGIMPRTLLLLGYSRDRIAALTKNKYLGSRVAAKHLSVDREIFGDDIPLLLHSYNGGAGLFDFTTSTPKEKRTHDAFYTYMEHYMNKRYQEIKQNGYSHEIIKGDTLSAIAERFQISIQELCAFNGLAPQSTLKVGELIRIPLRSVSQVMTYAFRKEYEVLKYTFEVRAKYNALRELNLIEALEANLSHKSNSFG